MKKIENKYIYVKKSNIHNKGIFAKNHIPKDKKIIEYIGEKITKKESERRSEIILSKHKKKVTHGAVYIFELNKRHDIDGNVAYNTAKNINHSCNPNCEAINIKGHIWIVSLRNIQKNEEITYNYGYDFGNHEEHICKCMSKNCIGFILADEHWPKLKITV